MNTITVSLPIKIERDRANGVWVATSPVVPGLIAVAAKEPDLSHKISLKLAEMADAKSAKVAA